MVMWRDRRFLSRRQTDRVFRCHRLASGSEISETETGGKTRRMGACKTLQRVPAFYHPMQASVEHVKEGGKSR